MSVLAIFCKLDITENNEKSLNQILNQILDITVSLSIQNPNIQPGVFLDKMRGCVGYGCPN